MGDAQHGAGLVPTVAGSASAYGMAFDVENWDSALVMNAPGQSGWPDSPHYKDLAALWAEGSTLPMAFTPAAVQRAARATLSTAGRK